MSVIERTTRWLCPEHPAVAVELPERGDRCMDCDGPLVEVTFVIVPAATYQRAVTAAVAVVEAWDQWIDYLSTAKIRIFGYGRISAAVEKLRTEVKP